MEIETMYLFIICTSIIGFFIGNLISPSTRWAKKEIQYWRGLSGDFKKQLKAEKRSNGDSGLDGLFDGDLSLGNIIKFAKNNPEVVAQFKDALGSVTNKPAIDDKSAFGDSRLR
jgi:hypothetical protein